MPEKKIVIWSPDAKAELRSIEVLHVRHRRDAYQ
jgi:hypothetical protein